MDQAVKLAVNVHIGEKIKTALTERLGIINSLTISFKPSAIGCKSPQKPTTLGPRLL